MRSTETRSARLVLRFARLTDAAAPTHLTRRGAGLYLAWLLVTWALWPAAAVAGPAARALDVPYLPQTERLCGGAATAMIFRYLGDRYADVQQFAPLVDRRAGGIPVDRLSQAIAEKGWIATRVDGTLESVRTHIEAGHPLLLLIEVRPRRYHFVVAVAIDGDAIVVHDPAIGPSRRYAGAVLEKRWAPSGFWALRIERAREQVATPDRLAPATVSPSPDLPTSTVGGPCDEAVADTIRDVRARGFALADELFGEVRRRCPTLSAPVSELAAVRFAERRWTEAAALAAEATRIDAADAYAWDVLGAARFAAGDRAAALDAWNTIGKPRLDTIRITGPSLTHYPVVAQQTGLLPTRLLTRDDYERAERRLRDLPTRAQTRVAWAPDENGRATVDVAVVERQRRPRGWYEWASLTTESLVRRELTMAVPGWGGQGDLWTASWRWWANRPRVGLAYSAPAFGRMPGIVTVDVEYGTQAFTADTRREIVQSNLHGGISLGHWLTSSTRYELRGGVDRWDGTRSAVSAGVALDRRFAGDRLMLFASGQSWWALDTEPGFRTVTLSGTWRSSTAHEGAVAVLSGGHSTASRGAPLAEWFGAGDQVAGSPQLRAHPFTHGGRVDGAGFGRHLTSASLEGRRWLRRSTLAAWGAAVFVDAAHARHGLRSAVDGRVNVDLGAGVRLRVPGRDGVLRLDYARGLVDGAQAVTLGWAP